jgi:hypothetical protein
MIGSGPERCTTLVQYQINESEHLRETCQGDRFHAAKLGCGAFTAFGVLRLSLHINCVRTIILFLMFSLLLVAGCATEPSPEESPSKRGFFESPDTESLH